MISLRTYYTAPTNRHSLVLIHAFPLTGSMWLDAAKIISEHAPAYNIIIVDLPGFGDSPVEESWTVAAAMVELHNKLNADGIVEPIIAGLSMGGYAAMAYYRLYFNEVKALILSNTKAAADTPDAKNGREEFAQDVEARGYEAVYERMLEKLVSQTAKKKDPDLIGKLKEWISSSSPQAIASALRALALRDDSIDLLSAISCPTLLITGEDDALIPFEEMEAMSS
ncbi:MAG: alpha/beta hydrolase, partial [Ignavibacteriota bacterium]